MEPSSRPYSVSISSFPANLGSAYQENKLCVKDKVSKGIFMSLLMLWLFNYRPMIWSEESQQGNTDYALWAGWMPPIKGFKWKPLVLTYKSKFTKQVVRLHSRIPLLLCVVRSWLPPVVKPGNCSWKNLILKWYKHFPGFNWGKSLVQGRLWLCCTFMTATARWTDSGVALTTGTSPGARWVISGNFSSDRVVVIKRLMFSIACRIWNCSDLFYLEVGETFLRF